jgi:hypothetical protein
MARGQTRTPESRLRQSLAGRDVDSRGGGSERFEPTPGGLPVAEVPAICGLRRRENEQHP